MKTVARAGDVRSTERKASRVLILSAGAGNMSPEVEARLRATFADHLVIPFDPKEDFEKLITPRARVVVAGGDGSVEFVVRKLADTKHPVGILSLGTFNNFALALGLPSNLDEQIEVVKKGRPRSITVGRVNGTVFLEACLVGLFGETIALGETLKDRKYGSLATDLAKVLTAKRFSYELEGDLKGSGSAMSLVFTNTSSIGSRLPVGDSTPRDHHLEFAVLAGRTRSDIAPGISPSDEARGGRTRPGVPLSEGVDEDEAACSGLRRQRARGPDAGDGDGRGQRREGDPARLIKGSSEA